LKIKIFEILLPKSTSTILAVAYKMANIQAILITEKFVSKIAFAFVTIYLEPDDFHSVVLSTQA
jgi:hypothetical protein